MSEAIGGQACPSCGRFVTTQYCPHCGAKVIFAGPSALPSDDAPTIPAMPAVRRPDGPAAAVPEMFPTEMVRTGDSGAPSQAWSQAPEPGVGPQTGLFPGWTGMYPAVATEGAVGALAPRPERRRRAILAVVGIAAVTVIVLVAALLITPHLGNSGNDANKDGQPVASSSAPPSPASSQSSPGTTVSSPAASIPAVPATPSTAKTTVTVTAPASTTGAPGTAPAKTAPVKTVPPKTVPSKTVPSKTVPPKTVPPKTTPKAVKPTPTPKPTPAAYPLGVPEREITCGAGYVVQLASELDAAAFTAHVNRLKAAGQLPAGALAADSAKSCKIFTSQVNTLVLYSGPYAGPYDGCAARLAGPADAYVKGSNPGTSQQYISCLCPANSQAVPQYQVGQQGVWVGEAQRVLGNRLNIAVSDLSGHWGTFTPGTKAAVQKFQASVKLPATGVLDHTTWKALQTAEC